MKHLSSLNVRKLCIAIICLIVFSFYQSKAGGLAGTYTIGSSGTYASFTKAVSDLASYGVSGPVVFNVANGSYNEQVAIGSVSGASATNTITFQSASGDSSKVNLNYASSTSSSSNYTLQLTGSRFITFKKISITRTGTSTYSTAVYMVTNSNSIQFLNCYLAAKLDPSTTTAGIVAGSPVLYSLAVDTNAVISNCRIKYGYNGIDFGTTGYNNSVLNNIIDTCGLAGVYGQGNQTNLLISGNTFNMGTVSVSGVTHYVSYGVRFESGTSYKIIKNRFYSTSGASVCRCVVLFGSTTASGIRNLIANNFLWVSAGTSSSTGITLGGGTNIDVVFNNVLMTSTPSISAAYYSYPTYAGSGIVIKNNNFINKGTGTAIDNENDSASSSITTGVAIEDYNNLYSTGTNVAWYRNTKYSSLSAYQSALKIAGAEANAISTYPGYVSNTDLHASSAAVYQAGVAFPTVTDDIDGNSRPSSKPCIGANEFVPLLWDAGVSVLDSPAVFCYPATKNLVVHFTNFGQNTLTSVTINWSVNGVTQTPYSWTGSLATGTVSSAINIGSYAFSSKNPYSLKIWTTGPNSNTDQKHTNDTLFKSVASGLNGTYYLGGTSPDFAKFNDVLNAVTLRGLCGPTVIRVRNGTYGEQMTIPSYTASSATNTITFMADAGDSSKVILTQGSASSSGVNNATVQFNGASYVNFKQMTISKTGTNAYQQVVEFKNSANHNSLQNCRLIGVLTAGSTYGDIIISDSLSTEKNNTFNNNAFKYGWSAINMMGQASSHESGNVISNNQIDSTYGPAIIGLYEDGISISGNKLTNVGYSASTNNAIVLTRSNNAISIMGNKISMPFGATSGIQLLGCNGTSSAVGTVANNFVSIATGSSTTPYGLYNNNSTYQNYYFNSVNISNTNTGADFYTNTASANLNVTDNIFSNVGGGYAIVSSTGTSPFAGTDYNDIYTTGTNVASYNGTADASLSAWQSATSMAAKSISTKPYFNSNTDLHTVNTFLSGLGTSISGINTDIDGKTRPSTPNMGAANVSPAANDAGITAVTGPKCAGSNSAVVTLLNNGTATLTSVTINWSVGGTTQTAYSYTGSLAPTKTALVTLPAITFASGTVAIKAWTSSPNGKTDSLPLNDTASVSATVNALPKASVISNSSVCPGTGISIGNTAVTGSTYAWVSSPTGFTSTSSNPSVTPLVNTTYTLTETNAAGCSASNSVTINLTTPPAAYTGTPTAVCSGNTLQLGGTAVSGNTYSWTSNPSGFTSTQSNPYVSPTSTTTYTLVETKGTCSATNSVKITVNALPAANAGSNTSICSGNSTSIGAAAVSGSAYTWISIPSGYTSTSPNPTVSPSATTTYVVYETNTTTGCVNLGAVVVTVNALPAANPGTSVAICTGSSTNIGATAISGNTYAWTSNPSGFTSTNSNPSVSPTVTTVYTLKETTSNGCSASNATTITVNALPTATITSSTTSACIGNTVTLSITSTGSGFGYQWYTGGSPISGSTKTSYFAGNTASYSAMVTNANGCSAMSNAISVTINALPVASIKSVGSTTRCLGDSVVLFANNIPGATYQWSLDGTGNISGATGIQLVAKNSGNYRISVTSASGCVSDTTGAYIPVTFNPVPTGSISPLSATVCQGTPVTIRTNLLTGVTYTWMLNNAVISGSTSNTISATAGGKYNVMITQKGTGCSSITSASVITVNAAPVAIIKALGNTKICQGNSLVLSANKSSDIATYGWSIAGTPISGANSDTFNAYNAGSYTLTATSSQGCYSNSSPVVVTVSTPASVSIKTPASTNICQGSPIELHSTLSGNTSQKWMLNGSSISGATNDSVSAGQTGNYTLAVSNADGCISSASIAITVNPTPVANFDASASQVCAGSSVTFYNVSSISSGTYTNAWDFGTGDNSTVNNPTYAFKTAGTYSVKLTAKSALGCSATAKSTVTVLPTNVSTFTAVHQGFRRMIMTPTDLTGASYSWNFGDNTLGNTMSPVHQYAADGSYTVTLTVTNANNCSSTTTTAVNVNATGISQATNQEVSINIFPNPYQGKTNVVYNLSQNSTVAVEVYDVMGKRVANVESSKQIAGEHSFMFNGEHAGTYFIKIMIDGIPYVNKVIQQN